MQARQVSYLYSMAIHNHLVGGDDGVQSITQTPAVDECITAHLMVSGQQQQVCVHRYSREFITTTDVW